VAGGDHARYRIIVCTELRSRKNGSRVPLFVDRHVSISEEDSHDHIYGLDLANSDDARVRIWFPRRQREHHEYPRCEQVAAVMKNQYGEPTAVQEFDEEPSRIVG
jgi:hypothetical protein